MAGHQNTTDAELLKLGEELRALYEEQDLLEERMDEIAKPWEPLRERAEAANDLAVYEAYWVILKERGHERLLGKRDDLLQGEITPREHRAMQIKATTMAGVALQAQILARWFGRLWGRPSRDLDWDDELLRLFLERQDPTFG